MNEVDALAFIASSEAAFGSNIHVGAATTVSSSLSVLHASLPITNDKSATL